MFIPCLLIVAAVYLSQRVHTATKERAGNSLSAISGRGENIPEENSAVVHPQLISLFPFLSLSFFLSLLSSLSLFLDSVGIVRWKNIR